MKVQKFEWLSGHKWFRRSWITLCRVLAASVGERLFCNRQFSNSYSGHVRLFIYLDGKCWGRGCTLLLLGLTYRETMFNYLRENKKLFKCFLVCIFYMVWKLSINKSIVFFKSLTKPPFSAQAIKTAVLIKNISCVLLHQHNHHFVQNRKWKKKTVCTSKPS